MWLSYRCLLMVHQHGKQPSWPPCGVCPDTVQKCSGGDRNTKGMHTRIQATCGAICGSGTQGNGEKGNKRTVKVGKLIWYVSFNDGGP